MDGFGSTIKKLRKEKKITQRGLADLTGIDFTYISKMENGKLENTPSIQIITKLAKALEKSADELILLADKVPETIRKTIVDDTLAAAFLRKIPELSEEQRQQIRNMIDET